MDHKITLSYISGTKQPELHESREGELQVQLRELQQDNRLKNLKQAAELEADWERELPGELLFTGVVKVAMLN